MSILKIMKLFKRKEKEKKDSTKYSYFYDFKKLKDNLAIFLESLEIEYKLNEYKQFRATFYNVSYSFDFSDLDTKTYKNVILKYDMRFERGTIYATRKEIPSESWLEYFNMCDVLLHDLFKFRDQFGNYKTFELLAIDNDSGNFYFSYNSDEEIEYCEMFIGEVHRTMLNISLNDRMKKIEQEKILKEIEILNDKTYVNPCGD